MAAANSGLSQDVKVIGLVGVAHGVSHFFHLILAPLFPWLKDAFSLSYAELGFLMTVFFIVSGVGQALAGFVVDRLSARIVLFFGLGCLAASALLLSVAQNYPMLLAGSMLAGLGNSVFHPADFTLLNKRVSRRDSATHFPCMAFPAIWAGRRRRSFWPVSPVSPVGASPCLRPPSFRWRCCWYWCCAAICC